MANNLHISYDLHQPGQNYDAVTAAIKSLGAWAKIHQSFWYVDSEYSATQAVEIVWRVMDANDKVYVVNATNNSAAWQNLPEKTKQFILDHWDK